MFVWSNYSLNRCARDIVNWCRSLPEAMKLTNAAIRQLSQQALRSRVQRKNECIWTVRDLFDPLVSIANQTSCFFFSWHTLLERCRVHLQSPLFASSPDWSVGCLLPCIADERSIFSMASNPPQLHVATYPLPVIRRLLPLDCWCD